MALSLAIFRFPLATVLRNATQVKKLAKRRKERGKGKGERVKGKEEKGERNADILACHPGRWVRHWRKFGGLENPPSVISLRFFASFARVNFDHDHEHDQDLSLFTLPSSLAHTSVVS